MVTCKYHQNNRQRLSVQLDHSCSDALLPLDVRSSGSADACTMPENAPGRDAPDIRPKYNPLINIAHARPVMVEEYGLSALYLVSFANLLRTDTKGTNTSSSRCPFSAPSSSKTPPPTPATTAQTNAPFSPGSVSPCTSPSLPSPSSSPSS